MIVKCIYNTGEAFLPYERKPFGVSDETLYNELEINQEYLVMGMILIDGYIHYLVDSLGTITACPSQLFGIIENTIPADWHFRTYIYSHSNYVNMEAVWGYYELVFDESHFYKVIDFDREAEDTYFRRKKELEKIMSLKEKLQEHKEN